MRYQPSAFGFQQRRKNYEVRFCPPMTFSRVGAQFNAPQNAFRRTEPFHRKPERFNRNDLCIFRLIPNKRHTMKRTLKFSLTVTSSSFNAFLYPSGHHRISAKIHFTHLKNPLFSSSSACFMLGAIITAAEMATYASNPQPFQNINQSTFKAFSNSIHPIVKKDPLWIKRKSKQMLKNTFGV